MQPNSNGTIILKSIIVIVLCIGGFSIMLNYGGILGILALLGSAVIGYFIFNNPFKNCDTKKIKSISKKYIIPSVLIIAVLVGAFFTIDKTIIQPKIKEKNIAKFKEKYEETLSPILSDYNLDLISIEYPQLIPDYEKDYYVTERINEYEVTVYVSGTIYDYERLYDLIISIRCDNDYLLSNTYEMMSSGAYVDDDCKETGFHQVHTTIVFEDSTAYKVDYISLLKNSETVWKRPSKPVTEESMVKQADAMGMDCYYEDCDSKRAEGRLYCHIHKCGVKGCTHGTSPLQTYCYEHRDHYN